MKTNTFCLSPIELICCACIMALLISCAPVFSELQSAKTLNTGETEFTAAYSSVSFTMKDEGDRDSEHMQNHIGLQAGYGLSDAIDMRVRYEYLWIPDADLNAHVVGIGPKFRIVDSHLAGYIPVGFAFGSDFDTKETWSLHPTIIGTYMPFEFLEINPSVKYLIFFQEDSESLLAINLGLGFSNQPEKWMIRPEFGLMYNPGEEGHYYHLSVGATIFPGALKK